MPSWETPVRDWSEFVRSRLALPQLTPEREARIVREIAAQLEDFYGEAIARGETDAQADAYARVQVQDWDRMARDLRVADRTHFRPRIERLTVAIEQIAEPKRGALKMVADLLTDFRYGLRQMLKMPGFTIVAVLTLAFGIGASTAIFSVVNGVMLRPFPYPKSEDLLVVFEMVPHYGRFAVAPANFLDWRRQNTVFERMATVNDGTDSFVGPEGPERITMTSVSWDFFDLLGVSPVLGRGFRADEDLPGQNAVIVLSHGMWQRRFGSDPNIVGRTMTLSGSPVTIVGVMPAGFYFSNREAEFWRPVALDPNKASRGAHFLLVIGRLKQGISVQQANAEMKTIAERLGKQYPATNRDESAMAIMLRDLSVGPIRPMLFTLLAAVAVVVLIACANVANLLLVRASAREKEIAIRAAMGAGRRRLVMQMLAESLVLASVGGALGVLLAWLSLTPIRTLSAGSIPRVAEVTLDPRVLGFAVLVSVATGILFGLAPAWQASRGPLGAALKEGGRSSATSGGPRLRSGLLVVEVASSIVLLVGATLLLRSFAKLTSIDLGFRADHVLTFRVALPPKSYPESQQHIAFFDRLLERLQNTPGVEAAGMAQSIPLRGDYMLAFTIQGKAAQPGAEPSANYRAVSPGYFAALRIPVVRGRSFGVQDTERSPIVAVVDQAFASRYFPNEDAIGRGIDIGNGTDGFAQIVGIVGDVHHDALDESPRPTMYVPFTQDTFGQMALLVRTTDDPAQFANTARQVVRDLDNALPAFGLAPLTNAVSDSLAQRRFSMLLLSVFAFVALFLAAVGLYGVVAYTVSLRTQEIGVRLAIGAEPAHVLRLVIGGGMKLAIAGVIVGIAAALGLARFVSTMLFNVTPFDPASYTITALVLLGVSVLACYIPARRAMAVDPLVALRQE
jgi:putative ABC transport system permease protein